MQRKGKTVKTAHVASSPPINLHSETPLTPITISASSSPPSHNSDDDNDFLSDESNPSDFPLPPPIPPNHVSFNQDYSCFAISTNKGFRIYNCDPFREIFRRDFDRPNNSGGGIGVVEMLFRCNILALVGGGTDPQYPLNKVMIWADQQRLCIGELSFRSHVKAVKLLRDKIVVVLKQRIFVYNFSDLKLLNQIETIENPKGLCAVSQTSELFVLVCLGLQSGQIRVEHYSSKRSKLIMAHDSKLACFALSADGQLIATASTKGTLVRIFNTFDGNLLQEVRRGADRAEIYSLAFSSTADRLAVSSDKGTIHVFGLKASSDSPMSETMPESYSVLFFIKEVLRKFFHKEWTVARFRLIEGFQYIVAFGHQRNTIIILGMDGSYYKCEFDPVKGGDMTQLEHHNFLRSEEDF